MKSQQETQKADKLKAWNGRPCRSIPDDTIVDHKIYRRGECVARGKTTVSNLDTVQQVLGPEYLVMYLEPGDSL